MTQFYLQYKSIQPYLQTTKKPEDGKEYKQSIADRKKLDGVSLREARAMEFCKLASLTPRPQISCDRHV